MKTIKITKDEILNRICSKESGMLNVERLAEFLAEVLPDQSSEEEINIPGFEGTREDLAKISIR